MKNLILLIPIAFMFLLSSCDKDDPVIPNEEELITTLNLSLVPADGSATVVLSFRDLDGDGGDAPVITTSALAANTKYTATLEFLNEQESPAEDITLEVIEEGEEHQVFFSSTVAGLNVSYTDEDASGNPIGVTSTIETSAAGSGQLTVTLRHEPAKDGANVAGGDIANAGGETDIEVTFAIDVE